MRERIIRGAGVTAAGFVLSRAITFASYIGIAALISPKDAGQFAAGSLVASIGTLFAESGMLAAVIQWRDDVDEAASTAFAATFLNGILLTGIAAATSPLLGAFFHSDRVGDIALACSGFLFLRSLMVVPDALLQRRFSFLRRVIIDPLGALTFGVVAIILCSQGMGPWGLVIGTYALFVAQVIAAWGFVRWRPRPAQMSMAVWRRLASFGRHVVASEIVRQSVSQLDQLLLGRFAGTAALGQYSYGMRLASQPVSGFISVAAYVLLPAFARVSDDTERLRESFRSSLAIATLLLLPASLILIPLGDQLALLAFGPEWGGAGNTIKALCLVGVGWMWASLASEAAKALGRPQILTHIHLVSLGVSVVAMPSLLWGDEAGIGAAVSLAAMVSGTYALRQVGGEMGLGLGTMLGPLRGAALAAGLSALAAGALDLLVFTDASGRGDAAVGVLGEGVTALVVFVVALRVLAPTDSARLGELFGHLRPGSREVAA